MRAFEMSFALFFTQPEAFSGSWVELLGLVTAITLLIGLYRHFECHVSSCHRIGRFTHGHFKLCRVHHPQVPSTGKITAEHVREVEKVIQGDDVAVPTKAPPET
jgi:hypothetical protein